MKIGRIADCPDCWLDKQKEEVLMQRTATEDGTNMINMSCLWCALGKFVNEMNRKEN